MCERERTEQFLKAVHYFKDDVFQRVPDLTTCEDVYAADLYTHECLYKRYLHRFLRVQSEGETPSEEPHKSTKHAIFEQAIECIDPLLKKGYGFTMTQIKDFMMGFDTNVQVYNYDVKRLLIEHYGDDVKFSPSLRRTNQRWCFPLMLQQMSWQLR